MARRTVSVTLKMNVLILISLTVGIGAVTAFLGYSLTRTIGETTRDSLEQEADLVYQALEQLMLPGEAPLVVDYFRGIDTIDPRYQTYLYRTDGTPGVLRQRHDRSGKRAARYDDVSAPFGRRIGQRGAAV